MYGDTHPENDNQDAGLEEELLAAFDDDQDVDVTVDGEEAEGEGPESAAGTQPENPDAGDQNTDTKKDGQPAGAETCGTRGRKSSTPGSSCWSWPRRAGTMTACGRTGTGCGTITRRWSSSTATPPGTT